MLLQVDVPYRLTTLADAPQGYDAALDQAPAKGDLEQIVPRQEAGTGSPGKEATISAHPPNSFRESGNEEGEPLRGGQDTEAVGRPKSLRPRQGAGGGRETSDANLAERVGAPPGEGARTSACSAGVLSDSGFPNSGSGTGPHVAQAQQDGHARETAEERGDTEPTNGEGRGVQDGGDRQSSVKRGSGARERWIQVVVPAGQEKALRQLQVEVGRASSYHVKLKLTACRTDGEGGGLGAADETKKAPKAADASLAWVASRPVPVDRVGVYLQPLVQMLNGKRAVSYLDLHPTWF